MSWVSRIPWFLPCFGSTVTSCILVLSRVFWQFCWEKQSVYMDPWLCWDQDSHPCQLCQSDVTALVNSGNGECSFPHYSNFFRDNRCSVKDVHAVHSQVWVFDRAPLTERGDNSSVGGMPVRFCLEYVEVHRFGSPLCCTKTKCKEIIIGTK